MSHNEQNSAGKRAFGERIRQLRSDRGWSQDDLATRSRLSSGGSPLSQSEISKIETASYSREPDRDTIGKLARAFEMESLELARGTPFSALFANSEVLTVGSSTQGPAILAYFASALTNLTPDQEIEIKALDEKVDNVCTLYDRHPLLLYRPRLNTSPTKHAQIAPRKVYDIDRKSVAESDLLILAGIFPSLGAGMELQLAIQSCSSVVLLIKEDQNLSKMVIGCPARMRIVKYASVDDLNIRLPEALDALVPHLVDCRRAFGLGLSNGVGQRIQQFREHRRLSQKDLARLVGVGTRYIQDLETMSEDVTNPSLLVLRRIAKVLSLGEGFLIAGYDIPIQLQNPAFAEHLKCLDAYASTVQMPADDYKFLWKQHVDRFALQLSMLGADRRVEIGDRKYWIEKHESLKKDNKKGLFAGIG